MAGPATAVETLLHHWWANIPAVSFSGQRCRHGAAYLGFAPAVSGIPRSPTRRSRVGYPPRRQSQRVLSLLSLPPLFLVGEVTVAMMVTGVPAMRPAEELVMLVVLLNAEVAFILVEIAASGSVIIVCNTPTATGNVLASLPILHIVADLSPHHQ